MNHEEWRPVAGYEGLYSVSNLGNVMSMDFNHTGMLCLLKPGLSRGYQAVTLYGRKSKPKRFTIHRLIAAAFIGSRPFGMQLNHKNGVKSDNRAENLEYCTGSQNMKHAFATGLQSNRGERHSRAKLSDEIVREIISRMANGESQTVIAHELDVDPSNISHIKRGRIWSHIRDEKAG